MAHHGNPALSHALNHILMAVHTLKLHGMRTGSHQDLCAIQRLGQTFPKREKRHVCDYEFAGGAAHDRLGVKTRQLDGHG